MYVQMKNKFPREIIELINQYTYVRNNQFYRTLVLKELKYLTLVDYENLFSTSACSPLGEHEEFDELEYDSYLFDFFDEREIINYLNLKKDTKNIIKKFILRNNIIRFEDE